MLKYAAIADDLTGATTVGVLLARSGIRTAALFSGEAVFRFREEHYSALCISTDSRAQQKQEAYRNVRNVTEHLKERGVKHFSKRIDTTLRGGIGTEIDAMLSVLGEGSVAVVVPAMPQSRRIVVGGYSIIDNIPLSRTSVSKDVKTPVTESHVPDLLMEQTSTRVGSIGLKSVLKGQKAVTADLIQAIREGCRIIVCDAVTLEDIDVLAESVLKLTNPVLAVDPGPFTTALTLKIEHMTSPVREEKALLSKEHLKTVLVVAGSATPVTRMQMQKLKSRENTRFVMVDPQKLIGDEQIRSGEKDRVKKEAQEMLDGTRNPGALILESSNGSNLNLNREDQKRGYLPGSCSALINDAMADVAASILEMYGEDRIAGFYTTGGDTMESVCKRLGVEAIEMVDYVIPQADLGRFIGRYEGLPIVGKGGLTGNEHTACEIVDRIVLESLKTDLVEKKE